MSTSRLVSTVMGAVLIVAGIFQIFFQMTIIAYAERILQKPPSFVAHHYN